MSEVVSAYKKIIEVVEANKIYKKPKQGKEFYSRIQHAMDNLESATMTIVEELRKGKKISEEEFIEAECEIVKIDRPYYIPKPDSYYEKIFGKKTVKLIREFIAIQ